jgi:hypothetical protein
MHKILLGAAALGALGFLTAASPAGAAAPKTAGVQSEHAVDLSAVHRPRHLRYGSRWVAPRYRYVRPAYRYRYVRPVYRYRYARPYRYVRPYPYYFAGGYPYYRPYYRPAPFPFLPLFW